MMAGGGLFPWIWLALAAYGVLAAASLLSLSAGKKADAAGRRVLERYGVQGPDEVIALARAYRADGGRRSGGPTGAAGAGLPV